VVLAPHQKTLPEIWAGSRVQFCRAFTWHGPRRGVALSVQVGVDVRLFTLASQESRVARAVIVGAMAVLVLAIGCCVFDRDDHEGMDDHATLDLCFGMLNVSLPIVLTTGLPLTGLADVYEVMPAPSFSPLVPAPPPKLLF